MTSQCQHLITLFSFVFITSHCQASRDFIFPDARQAHFAGSLKEFMITTPAKVNEDGLWVSDSVHHIWDQPHSPRLRKRDLSTPQLHYKFNVDGMDLHLQLVPSDMMFSPGLIVERRKSIWGNASDSTIVKMEKNKCHFNGKIKGHPGSALAVATCGGLTGLLRTKKGDFFIEPVKGHDFKKSSKHPHLVYKRSALPAQHHVAHTENMDGTCGVEDDSSQQEIQRERWEIHERYKREGSHSNSHRRKKRSVSLERNAETLIVVDHHMTEYYSNEDIETYVLTIMNMVQTLFHDSTIGNAVNIVLVRLMLLEGEEKGLKVMHHADTTLGSFCKWQKKINPKDDRHPSHHDLAVLLTRKNICSRMNEPCSTLGLAQVSGLCQPHRSCNINEDTGLSLAFTVAHEIGHNFGMKHDGRRNGCKSKPGEPPHVMAPQLTVDTNPLVWSKCSKEAITKFLDRNWGFCLDDEPSDHDFQFPILPPGVMYDADHQCRLQYGEDAEFCDGIDDVCSTLWCRVNNKCLTRLETAAEGTLCGENEWCFAGNCVTIGERPQSINGEWAEWGSWTPCSRTCGAGVSYAERLCNNPPPSYGGKYCLGERKRYRICNTKDCPSGKNVVSFRQQQCTEYNYIPYKNGLYEWEEVATPSTPCQLHCRPRHKFFSVMLQDMVADGTPCNPGTRDMCISGRCRHVGCDWVIESNAKEDHCGVCHGDGSTCTTVKNEFKKQQGQVGYVEAMLIPQGARHIRVEEVAEANNYLAVKDDEGHYLLNGNWFIQWSGDYNLAGTTLQYRRQGDQESFTAPGPLKEAIHIMLLFQGKNPGVKIEFTIPNANITERRRSEFRWKYLDWSHCTSSCGGGSQRAVLVCEEVNAGIVDDKYCNISTKTDDRQRSCNDQACPARWWMGPWQHCSVTCGTGGHHRRTVICVRSLGADQQIALEDKDCEDQAKPLEVEPCKRKNPCPGDAHWKVGPWSQTCSGDPCSIQTRAVTCSDQNAVCPVSDKPSWNRFCGNITCGVWKAGNWSQCSRICGSGFQRRHVYCSGGQACRNIDKPSAQRVCKLRNCQGNYFLNDKSKSNNLNLNQQNKPLNPAGNKQDGPRKGKHLSSSLSSSPQDSGTAADHLRKLDTDMSLTSSGDKLFQSHSDKESPNKTHATSMKDNAENHPGDSQRKEEISSTQVKKSDTHRWAAMFWQECTKPCGLGTQYRAVGCYDIKSRQAVDAIHCHGQKKPVTSQPCNERPCHPWTTSDWQPCPGSCGTGTQVRRVHCPHGHHCDRDKKPADTRLCHHKKPCLEWVISSWTPCTKSCGRGVQERLVECRNVTSELVASGCPMSTKPLVSQSCNMQACPAGLEAKSAVTKEPHIFCHREQMSSNACRMLRHMSQCGLRYIQIKCCRTCAEHTRSVQNQRLPLT